MWKKSFYITFFSIFIFLSMNIYAFRYSGTDIKVIGSISEMYIDNITYTSQKQKKDDFITNFILGLSLKHEKKTEILDFSGNINQQIFLDNHSFNNNSQYFNLFYKRELSKYIRFQLKNFFIHYIEPRSFEYEFGRTGGRYSYYHNKLNFNCTQDLSKELTINVHYANHLNNVSRKNLSDSYLNSIGIKTSYLFSSTSILSLLYDFTHKKYNNPDNTNYIYHPALCYQQYFTKQLYSTSTLGLDFIKSSNDKNYTKPVFLTALTDTIDNRSTLKLLFSIRNHPQSHSQNITKEWKISCFFIMKLLKKMTYSFSSFYGHGKYISTESKKTYNLNGLHTSLNYEFWNNIKGILEYTYSISKSSDNSNNYIRNKIFLGLTIVL